MPPTPLPARQPYTFDRVVRIVFYALTIAGTVFIIDILKGVLLPFAVACLIAYMLEPIVEWNIRWMRTKRRLAPVLVTLTEAALLATLLGFVFVPYIVSETAQMTALIRHYASTQIDIPYISGAVHDFIRQNIDFDEISKMLSKEEWADLIKSTVSSSWSFLSSGIAYIIGVLGWLVVVLYVFFIMLDYRELLDGLKKLLPLRHRDRIVGVANDVKKAMNNYFRGQFIIAMLVGVLFAIGFLIVGLPMAVVLGLFIGLLNLVPYLQLLSIPITILLCLVCSAGTGINFWVIFWECMAVYAVVQCIQDLYLTPRIMGKAMGLNPAVILLSLSIWGTLLGFIGLIIALPLTTLLLSYLKRE